MPLGIRTKGDKTKKTSRSPSSSRIKEFIRGPERQNTLTAVRVPNPQRGVLRLYQDSCPAPKEIPSLDTCLP